MVTPLRVPLFQKKATQQLLPPPHVALVLCIPMVEPWAYLWFHCACALDFAL